MYDCHSDTEFDHYEKYKRDGWIRSELIEYCILHPDSIDPRIQEVSRAYEQLKKLVSDVKCKNQGNPFEQKITIGNYCFKRLNYIGRHMISITRSSIDRFQLTVNVKYTGDFWKEGNKVQRIGYSLISTNGNYQDVKEAVETTRDLW